MSAIIQADLLTNGDMVNLLTAAQVDNRKFYRVLRIIILIALPIIVALCCLDCSIDMMLRIVFSTYHSFIIAPICNFIDRLEQGPENKLPLFRDLGANVAVSDKDLVSIAKQLTSTFQPVDQATRTAFAQKLSFSQLVTLNKSLDRRSFQQIFNQSHSNFEHFNEIISFRTDRTAQEMVGLIGKWSRSEIRNGPEFREYLLNEIGSIEDICKRLLVSAAYYNGIPTRELLEQDPREEVVNLEVIVTKEDQPVQIPFTRRLKQASQVLGTMAHICTYNDTVFAVKDREAFQWSAQILEGKLLDLNEKQAKRVARCMHEFFDLFADAMHIKST